MCKLCKTRSLMCCTYSIALYCRTITMSPAKKQHLSSPQFWMGQVYRPKVCPFRSAWHQGHTICNLSLAINLSLLSEQVTFHLQPRKQLHTLTPISANFMILSAVTKHGVSLHLLEIMRYCCHKEPMQHGYIYSHTSDFQQALWKVIIT